MHLLSRRDNFTHKQFANEAINCVQLIHSFEHFCNLIRSCLIKDKSSFISSNIIFFSCFIVYFKLYFLWNVKLIHSFEHFFQLYLIVFNQGLVVVIYQLKIKPSHTGASPFVIIIENIQTYKEVSSERVIRNVRCCWMLIWQFIVSNIKHQKIL